MEFVLTQPDTLRKIISEEIQSAISQSLLPLSSKPKEEKYYTVQELSKELQISKVTLFKLKKEGKIPFVRIGSRIRFLRSEIETTFQNYKKKGRTAQ